MADTAPPPTHVAEFAVAATEVRPAATLARAMQAPSAAEQAMDTALRVDPPAAMKCSLFCLGPVPVGPLGQVYCAPSKGRLARRLAVIMFRRTTAPLNISVGFRLDVLWLLAW